MCMCMCMRMLYLEARISYLMPASLPPCLPMTTIIFCALRILKCGGAGGRFISSLIPNPSQHPHPSLQSLCPPLHPSLFALHTRFLRIRSLHLLPIVNSRLSPILRGILFLESITHHPSLYPCILCITGITLQCRYILNTLLLSTLLLASLYCTVLYITVLTGQTRGIPRLIPPSRSFATDRPAPLQPHFTSLQPNCMK